MTAGRIKKSPEFLVGVLLALLTVVAVGLAIFCEDWRRIVQAIGAPIASGGVLGAALIAYDGAISKVRFDNSVHTEKNRREARAAFAKLDLACDELFSRASDVMDSTKWGAPISDSSIAAAVVGHDAGSPEVKNRQAAVSITVPAGITEAWSHLELFSKDVIYLLNQISRATSEIDSRVQLALMGREPLKRLYDRDFRDRVTKEAAKCRDAAAHISEAISDELEKLVPRLSAAKKLKERRNRARAEPENVETHG